jgi:phosphate-selective porin OprO and OprP
MRKAAALVSLATTLAPVAAAIAQAPADPPTIEQRLAEQEQRIKVLERKLELANEATKTAAATTPVVKATPSGFSLNAADGGNVIKLRGTLNLDGRYFTSFDRTANLTNGVAGSSAYNSADGFLTRKIRPIVEGTINGIYDFRIQPDFAGGKAVILDSYVAARLAPWAVVTVGKFKNPVGLERLQTEQYNKFLEPGFPSSLLPYRDLGVQFSGAVLNGVLNYAGGIFDGTIDGSGSDGNPTPDANGDNKLEFSGRLFALPFANSSNDYLRGLGVGIGGTAGSKSGNASVSLGAGSSNATTATQVVPFITTNTWLPSYRTAAQQMLFSYRGDNAVTLSANDATYADGSSTRIAPQAYYYFGSLGVLAEYAVSSQAVSRHTSATVTRSATVRNKAWQIAASYFLTGEDAAYNSATPAQNFAIGSPGIGAWEIAARYQRLSIDNNAFTGGSSSFANPATAVSAARGISLALNWYLTQSIRWTAEYDRTSFDGGAGSSGLITDRKDETAFVTRFALAF